MDHAHLIYKTIKIMIHIDYTFWIVCVGSTTLGLCSGLLSPFAILRKQSLLGDALAHATLPGLCFAFLLQFSKSSLLFFIGAVFSAFIAAYFIHSISLYSRLKPDASMGLVLSVFFGFGLLLLTLIQKMPYSSQSGLTTFLFGSAASLLLTDIYLMSAVCLFITLCIYLFFKELSCSSFDRLYSASTGMAIKKLDLLFLFLLVINIVIGLQTVGVILMSALLIAPGATARQWTSRMSLMILLSVLFSCLSCILGVVISSSYAHIPTGPSIVLFLSFFAFISILLAPKRGIISAWFKQKKQQKLVSKNWILQRLMLLSKNHSDPYYAHHLDSFTLFGKRPTKKALLALHKEGLVLNPSKNCWGLSKKGFAKLSKS